MGIKKQIQVSHPDADSIIWELDIPGIAVALEFPPDTQGCLRLHFRRAEYEADLAAMLSAVHDQLAQPVAVDRLTHCAGFKLLKRDFPSVDAVAVIELEPLHQGQLAELLTIQRSAPFMPKSAPATE